MPFPRTLNQKDLVVDGTVLVAGQWVELGRFTVGAGQGFAAGWGGLVGLDSAEARAYLDLRNNAAPPGAVIQGLVRLDIETPQRRVYGTVFERRTERLRASAADDLRVQLPFAERDPVVGENWSFVLRVMADAGATVGQANTTLLFDMTAYDTA